MGKIIRERFFNRDTKIVAKELLGKFLVRKVGNKEISVMITETEAYDGFYDKASHAHKGRTKRTEVMFGNPGVFYVYLCYGVYFMLNIVTRKKDYPAAVLIRGARSDDLGKVINGPAPLETTPALARPKGLGGGLFLTGPGKITKFLNIGKDFNNKKSGVSTNLWLEDRGIKINNKNIKKFPRIGVRYAGAIWAGKKLRFVLEN